MFLSRNKKNNGYPCKPQFYCVKVGFKGGGGSKLYRYVFVMMCALTKTQISLGMIRVFACAQRVAKDPSILQVDSECSDWADSGRTCHFVGFVMSWLNYADMHKYVRSNHCLTLRELDIFGRFYAFLYSGGGGGGGEVATCDLLFAVLHIKPLSEKGLNPKMRKVFPFISFF